MPLGNILPAIAICLFSCGILERDGVFVLLGTAMFAVSVSVVAGVVYALVKGFILLVTTVVM
ncbi:Exopolysaccharide synthesis, ExoD [compost metagenome]